MILSSSLVTLCCLFLADVLPNQVTADGSILPTLFDVKDNVHFLYFSRYFKGFHELKPGDPHAFKKADFRKHRPTKVVIHGWLDAGNDTFCETMKNAYLEVSNYNVITVDWSSFADNFYTVARLSVQLVAPYVAEMLDYLVSDYGVPAENIHIIGHSLGSHIAGLAGKKMKTGTVCRITGLDPAAPEFFLGKDYRLDKEDADFVDVIHTSIVGYHEPIGDADFYPNGGGPSQDGCGLNIVCTHKRAYDYYIESLTSPTGFVSWNCTSWDDFVEGFCDNNYMTLMGAPVSANAKGKFYLRTNSSPPFALGFDTQRNPS